MKTTEVYFKEYCQEIYDHQDDCYEVLDSEDWDWAIKEYTKDLLAEYTEHIIKNAKVTIVTEVVTDHLSLYGRRYESVPKIDKQSIKDELEVFLKELQIL